jgi:hypothetical protein
MALPTQYLTSTKNLKDILTSLQTAQAPKQFNRTFLENLGYKSSSDRLVIGVLKALGFLTDQGAPTPRYFEYLDQTQSGRVLAEGIQEAYADLYELNTKAQTLPRDDLKGKMRSLTQGQVSDAVLDKMVVTFQGLAKEADFKAVEPATAPVTETLTEDEQRVEADQERGDSTGRIGARLGGLVYNIQIQLPESRDPAVYDALFRSLKTHLLP